MNSEIREDDIHLLLDTEPAPTLFLDGDDIGSEFKQPEAEPTGIEMDQNTVGEEIAITFQDADISRYDYGEGNISRSYSKMLRHRLLKTVYWPLREQRFEK